MAHNIKTRKARIDTREKALTKAIDKAIAEAARQGRASYANRNQATGSELLDNIKNIFEAAHTAKGGPPKGSRGAALDAWNKLMIAEGFSFAVNNGISTALDGLDKQLDHLDLPAYTEEEKALVTELAIQEFSQVAKGYLHADPANDEANRNITREKALARGYSDAQYNAAYADREISGFETHRLKTEPAVVDNPAKGEQKDTEQRKDSVSTSEGGSGATRSGKWGDGLRGNTADSLRGGTRAEDLVSSLAISDPENVIGTDLDMIKRIKEERSLINTDQERLAMVNETENSRPSGFLNGLSGNILLQS